LKIGCKKIALPKSSTKKVDQKKLLNSSFFHSFFAAIMMKEMIQ